MGLEVFGFGWGVVGCVFGSVVRVKAVVGVVVVYTPAEDPVAVTFFVRIPVIVVARGIGTGGNVEFELETVFPR